MKAVILAGGLGSRLSEETHLKPKPMIEIGGKPIIWHIMKSYSSYGINDFIICAGYKGYFIKEYFANYYLHQSDVTFDMRDNSINIHNNNAEPWTITIVDTKSDTMTGGRIKRIKDYIDNKTFCLTYGDGLGDMNIKEAISFHQHQKVLATVTATCPPNRFGTMSLENNKVKSFQEKAIDEGSWVNAGFFILEPQIFDYIEGDDTIWETKPLENLARDNQLAAFKHYGFWQPMDTLRDKLYLEKLIENSQAPWMSWDKKSDTKSKCK